jgi:hypothetical protein
MAEKERKKSLTRGYVEDIGSAEGIQSYGGQGYEGAMSGKYFCDFPVLPSLRDGCALRGACRARPMNIYGDPGDRLLSPLGRAYTMRFLFLMMPRRRDCAKPVIESISNLNRMKSNRDGMLVRAEPTGRLGKGTGYGYWLPGPDRLRE